MEVAGKEVAFFKTGIREGEGPLLPPPLTLLLPFLLPGDPFAFIL